MFLGNNADDFMTKPMPISVTTQEAAAKGQAEMAAPRETTREGQLKPSVPVSEPPQAFRPTSGFLPGLGQQDMLPGMGEQDMLPGMGEGIMDRLMSPVGLFVVGGGLWYLFGTKGGKALRKRIGMA